MYLLEISDMVKSIKEEAKEIKKEEVEQLEGRDVVVAIDKPLAVIIGQRLKSLKEYFRVSTVGVAMESDIAMQLILPSTKPLEGVRAWVVTPYEGVSLENDSMDEIDLLTAVIKGVTQHE